MKSAPVLTLFVAVAALLVVPESGTAQMGSIVKKLQSKVEETEETLSGVDQLGCDVAGRCGDVTRAEHFSPLSYQTLAVTVFDGTRRFASPGVQGMVQDAFESALVEKGYLLAAGTDARGIQQKLSQTDQREWSNAQLAQLKDLVQNIDAVLVVDIRQLDRDLCEVDGNPYGSLARVHLSARWLNADAGDVPWVAEHHAEACDEGRGTTASTEALQTVASQLASVLPSRDEN